MSDSIKKYEEMLEEGRISDCTKSQPFIYESPDNGQTITRRVAGADDSTREVIRSSSRDVKKQAYEILLNFDEEAVRYAYDLIKSN